MTYGDLHSLPTFTRLMGHLMMRERTDHLFGTPYGCRAEDLEYKGEKAYRIEPPPDDVRRREHAVFPDGRWKQHTTTRHAVTKAEETLDGTYEGVLKWTAISMMDAGDILNKVGVDGVHKKVGRNKYPWED